MYNYQKYKELGQFSTKSWILESSALVSDFLGVWAYSESDTVIEEIEVRVNLSDLRRAFRRLLARLPDEAKTGDGFVIFSADRNSLGIVAGGTSEALSAAVIHVGQASVPSPVFRGIARTLRFYRKSTISLAFRAGTITIDRTEFRHENISVQPLSHDLQKV